MKAIKLVPYYLIFNLGLFLFTGCELEQDYTRNQPRSSYAKIEEVPFLIPKIQEYSRRYNYLSDPQASKEQAKYNEDELDLAHILVYEYGEGKITYSVKILKEFEQGEDKYYENLHIFKLGDEFKSFIIKYNQLNDTEVFNLQTFTGDLEVYNSSKEYQGLAQFENGEKRCNKFNVGGWVVWIHNGTVDVWYNELLADSSSGSNNNNQNNNPEPQPLFLANTNPPIGENSGGGINNLLAEPCATLAKLADPQQGNIKPEIDIMKQKVLDEANNYKKEWGFTMNSVMNPDGSFSYPKTPLAVSPGLSIELEYTQITIFGAHTHPSDGHSIPSFGDVFWLRDLYKQATNTRQKDVTLFTVCKEKITGQAVVYALFVSDFAALDAQVNAKLNLPKYSIYPTEKDRINAILVDEAIKNEKSKNNLEKHFLQQFSAYGISLFKATNNDLTQWEKLELNTNPNALPGQQLSVAGVPCS